MKQKLVALFLVIVMVASTLTAVGLATTTTVAAAATTQTTLTVSTPTPIAGQSVIFTATLKSGTTPLSSKPVTIFHYLNGVWYTDTTKTTNANGQITLTQSFGSAGQRSYYARFSGDNTYKTSTSIVVIINVPLLPTVVKLSPSTATPTVGQSVTFTAKLYWWNPAPTNQWMPFSGKSVTIFHYLNNVRYTDTTKTTNANGQITLTQSFGSAGQRSYYATFAGNTAYAKSTSIVVPITVKLKTILSPNSAVTGRSNVGQTFSLNGFLTDQNGKGLAGQKIQLYSRTSTSAPWEPFVAVYTGSDGYYQYGVFFDQLATMQYQAKYAGDSTHLAASSGIWDVKWRFQPQLSLQVTTSLLRVGGTVFFSGYLKDQTGFRPGEPLVGRTVTLYWRNDPNSGWNKGPTATTNQYGYYSFGTSSDHSQTVYYYVSYDPAKQIPPESNTYWNVDSSQVTVTWT